MIKFEDFIRFASEDAINIFKLGFQDFILLKHFQEEGNIKTNDEQKVLLSLYLGMLKYDSEDNYVAIELNEVGINYKVLKSAFKFKPFNHISFSNKFIMDYYNKYYRKTISRIYDYACHVTSKLELMDLEPEYIFFYLTRPSINKKINFVNDIIAEKLGYMYGCQKELCFTAEILLKDWLSDRMITEPEYAKEMPANVQDLKEPCHVLEFKKKIVTID